MRCSLILPLLLLGCVPQPDPLPVLAGVVTSKEHREEQSWYTSKVTPSVNPMDGSVALTYKTKSHHQSETWSITISGTREQGSTAEEIQIVTTPSDYEKIKIGDWYIIGRGSTSREIVEEKVQEGTIPRSDLPLTKESVTPEKEQTPP